MPTLAWEMDGDSPKQGVVNSVQVFMGLVGTQLLEPYLLLPRVSSVAR